MALWLEWKCCRNIFKNQQCPFPAEQLGLHFSTCPCNLVMNSGNSVQLGIFGSFIQILSSTIWSLCLLERGNKDKLKVHQRVVHDGGRWEAMPSRCPAPKPVLCYPLAWKWLLFTGTDSSPFPFKLSDRWHRAWRERKESVWSSCLARSTINMLTSGHEKNVLGTQT